MEKKTNIDKYIEMVEKGSKLTNFCENYHMNDPIKETIFKKKYNHPNFIHVFYKQNEYSKRLFKSIDNRIQDQNNAIFVIYGEPHLGKSEGAQGLAKYIQKRFSDLLRINVKIEIAFTMTEFDEIIRDLPPGDIVIYDEDPSEAGTDSKVIRNGMNNLLKIGRADQNFFFFCSPVRVETAVVTYFLEAGGKNKDERMLRFILYDLNYQNGKIPLGRVKIKLHDDEEFRKKYEMRKKRNITIGKQQGMIFTHQINEERKQQQVQRLVDFCEQINARTYTRIKSNLSKYNFKCQQERREKEMITGSVEYIKIVIQDVYDILNHVNRKIKEGMDKIEVPEIKVINGSGLAEFTLDYYEKNLPEAFNKGTKVIERSDIIEVLTLWIRGIGIRDIAFSIDNLYQVLVHDIIKLFKDGKRHETRISDELRLYKVYEYWCAKRYGLEIVSGHNQPDFYLKMNGKKIPGECKLWDNIQTNISLDKRKKFHSYNNPEENQESFPVLWRNVKWGDHDYFYDVPINGVVMFNFEKAEQYILQDKAQLHEFYE